MNLFIIYVILVNVMYYTQEINHYDLVTNEVNRHRQPTKNESELFSIILLHYTPIPPRYADLSHVGDKQYVPFLPKLLHLRDGRRGLMPLLWLHYEIQDASNT